MNIEDTELQAISNLYVKGVTLQLFDNVNTLVATGKFTNPVQTTPDAIRFDVVVEPVVNGAVINHAAISINAGKRNIDKRVTFGVLGEEGKMFLLSGLVVNGKLAVSPVQIQRANRASAVVDAQSKKVYAGVGVVFRAKLPDVCERCGGTQWNECETPLYPPVPEGTKCYECASDECLQYEYLK